MNLLPFSIFKQNGKEYEVVDRYARNLIDSSIHNVERVVVVSDSYGKAASATNFVEKLKTKLNLGTNNFYNISENSIGFIHTGGNNNYNALQLLTANINSISNKNTITDVVTTVGINDTTVDSLGSIETAVGSYINYCKTQFPNARIWFGFAGNSSGSDSYTITMADRYYKLIPLICNKFIDEGCYVIKGLENVLHDATNLSDDWLHPNANGAEELAKYVYKYITTGEAHYRKYYKFTNNDAAELYININDDVTSINIASVGNQSSGTISGAMNLINTYGSAIRGIKAIENYFPYQLIVGGTYQQGLAIFRESRLKLYTIGLSGNYTGTSKYLFTTPTIMI